MSVRFDGTNGLEVTLPSGKKVTRPCLKRTDAIHFLRLAEKAKADPEARFQLWEEFPEKVNMAAEWDDLTAGEYWNVFWDFFDVRAKPGEPSPTPTSQPTGTPS